MDLQSSHNGEARGGFWGVLGLESKLETLSENGTSKAHQTDTATWVGRTTPGMVVIGCKCDPWSTAHSCEGSSGGWKPCRSVMDWMDKYPLCNLTSNNQNSSI